jgi:hypothetical protein
MLVSLPSWAYRESPYDGTFWNRMDAAGKKLTFADTATRSR